MRRFLLLVLASLTLATSLASADPSAVPNEKASLVVWAWTAAGVSAAAGAGLAVWGLPSGDLAQASAAAAFSTVLFAWAALAVEYALNEPESK